MIAFASDHFDVSTVVNRLLRTRTDTVAGVVVDPSVSPAPTATLMASVGERNDAVRVERDDRVEYHQMYRLAYASDPLVNEGDTIVWGGVTGLCRGPATDMAGKGLMWFVTVDVIR